VGKASSSQTVIHTVRPAIYEKGSFINEKEWIKSDSLIVICDVCDKSDTTFVSVTVGKNNQIDVSTYYPSSNIRSRYHLSNKAKEGIAYRYFESGQIESFHFYHLGVVVLPFMIYYESGNLKLFSKLDSGSKSGIDISYYSSGEINGTCTFEDSSEEKVCIEYYKSGKILSTSYGHKDNLLYFEYYENGKLKVEGRLRDGLSPMGVWKKYYDNGNLMFEKKFKLNIMFSRPEGEWKYYDENGKLLKTVVPDYTEQIDDIIKVINEDK